MSRFPRVAARTRPKPPPAIKLPPLHVGLYDTDGELVRTIDIPDPRVGFCREWMTLNSGLEARPLEVEHATPRRRKAVAHG
jgi:hypothetical protein